MCCLRFANQSTPNQRVSTPPSQSGARRRSAAPAVQLRSWWSLLGLAALIGGGCDSGAVSPEACETGAVEDRLCFASATVPAGENCSGEVQTRTCVNGGWLPNWPACEHLSCTPEGTAKSCGNVSHGGQEDRTCYASASVPAGGTCQGTTQSRTCQDGAWSPDWPACDYLTCSVEGAASCGSTPDGGQESRICYAAAQVPYGQTCQGSVQTRTCQNGSWSPDWPACDHLSCTVQGAANCGSTPSGGQETRTCYDADQVPFGQTCTGTQQTRTCVDGKWSPDWPPCAHPTCVVQGVKSCGSTPSGGQEIRTCYAADQVPFGQTCSGTQQTRTCQDGVWSPDWPACAHLTCSVAPAASCGSTAHGAMEVRTCYQVASVPAGKSCQGTQQTRTCNNGSWSPDWPACNGTLSCAAMPTPPSQWKGINYYPRRHQYYHMLNDWFAVDQTTGKPLNQVVDADLTLLAANGFNFLHLYLWDNTWFDDHIGFNPPLQDPRSSANQQWAALEDFLAKAAAHGLYVALHFVAKKPIDDLNSGLTLAQADQLGTDYYNWTKPFLQELPQRHANILLWGFNYALGPVPDQGPPPEASSWNVFVKSAYSKMDQALAPARTANPGTSLLGVNLMWSFKRDTDGYHYSWDWKQSQRAAKVMTDMGLREPDIYMLQLYNANSMDIERDLKSLAGTASSNGISVAANKILAVEFATSSSLAPAPQGNGIISSGDADTPTTDLTGHAQWLTNSLCAFQRAGLKKLAYWALYDGADFWQAFPFNQTGKDLAWNGYWGLYSLDSALPAKPAWSVLSNYYKNGTLACSQPPPPILAVRATPESVNSGQTLTLGWSAADVDFTSLTSAGQVTQSIGTTTIEACGSGPTTYTLRASNGQQTATATTSVLINGAGCTRPIIETVSNDKYGLDLQTTSTIIVWGSGFTAAGNNTVQCQRSGYGDVWLYKDDGHYYWDQSANQINSSLDGRLAAGQWTITVRDANAAPSLPFLILIR